MNIFDVARIREDFPILNERVNGHPLIYLDNAATTQKPRVVIDALSEYYRTYNANVHRAAHTLGEKATEAYEAAREKVQHFINARCHRECIFVRGTTEAINLVAQSFVGPRISPGEEILITHMEHHSNIVPWQLICKQTGALLRVAPINIQGELLIDAFENLITEKTKFIALTHASNALGTLNPIKRLIEIAHRHDVLVLVDGAQAAPHIPIDVQDLDCDFYAFSGHKMYGPTGIGVLWGREALLETSPPYQGGGEMISHVSFELTEYKPIPYKFEAGTPNIAGAIGLGVAIDYLESLDGDALFRYESSLLEYANAALKNVHGINVIGTAREKLPMISFVYGQVHAHDIGTVLNSVGIAVRSGHHCAMPLMDFFDVPATTRASFSFYNTFDEIDQFVQALAKVREVFTL